MSTPVPVLYNSMPAQSSDGFSAFDSDIALSLIGKPCLIIRSYDNCPSGYINLEVRMGSKGTGRKIARVCWNTEIEGASSAHREHLIALLSAYQVRVVGVKGQFNVVSSYRPALIGEQWTF